MRTECRLLLVTTITGGPALASGPARADVTKDQCPDANAKGQELRRDSTLSAAREQLDISDATCPMIVRDDCRRDRRARIGVGDQADFNGHQELTHLGHEELTHPGVPGRVALTQ